MPEVAENKQPEAAAPVAQPVEANPFDESSWTQQPSQQVESQKQDEGVKPDPAAAQPEQRAADDEQIIDANEYLKQQLGYESWDAAKTELQQLRELKEKAQTPAEIKFANEQSQKFFDAIREGKTDDIYAYLHKQKQLERLEKLEIAGINEAAEIIKANLQFKNPDLTQKEIEFLYNKRYSIPKQPRQGSDQSDEEYEAVLEEWKQVVQEKEQEIIIEGKVARPEVIKYKSELVLPDIPNKVQPQQQAPDPKVLEAQAAARELYLKAVESDYRNFNGFDAKVKSESGELPVAFNVPDEEKVVYANKLKDFDINEFFENRWFPEGKTNVAQMMSDLYFLENPGKVLQGLSNNAASTALDNYLKTKSKIKVDGGSSKPDGFTPTAKDIQAKQEEALWDA
jgi:hypothetical protein